MNSLELAPASWSYHGPEQRTPAESLSFLAKAGTPEIIDQPAILDEVRKHGFEGNVSIEYEFNWRSSLPEISQCVGYLRAYAKLTSYTITP